MGTQLIIHGIPTIDTLKESTGIWSPDTSAIRRTPNNTHGSASENVVGKGTLVGAAVGDYREENYKTDFEIWSKISKLQSEPKNIEMSRPPLDSTPVGVKTSDAKTPATDSSARKVKA